MKKTRKWLSDSEALHLGLKLNKKNEKRGKAKYLVSFDQEIELNKFRGDSANGFNSDTKPNEYKPKPFVMSAWDEVNGVVLSPEEYCKRYNLDHTAIVKSKFLPYHYSFPTYHIDFREQKPEDQTDFEALKDILRNELSKREKDLLPTDSNKFLTKEVAHKWADLHLGADIAGLIRTPDYNSSVLRHKLLDSVGIINGQRNKVNHIHIMGDIIESFSGLNHINSWVSMNKDEIGANVVRLAVKILDESLSRINNLGCVKIVGGNHDRGSQRNDLDVKGSIADIIAFGLELLGYDVEFNPYVITHRIGDINHILFHGDKKISNRSIDEIINKYGEPKIYNFVFKAHLHSTIEKLTVKSRERFETTTGDGSDRRMMYCPAFFTGNFYSETLGFDSNAGFLSVSDNGLGKPNVFNYSI